MSLTTTGGNALIPQTMDAAIRMAELMARAKMVPAHLQGSPGDCLLIVEQAGRWGMSPFAVAQCTSVIQGKLMFEGKLVAAALHTSGALATRLAYDYTGEGAARAVRVSATLAGEAEPRFVDVRLADAKTTNQLWTKQPDQQLAYHGARVWAQRYAPEVMLGVYAPEEMEPPTRPAPAPHAGPTIDAMPEAPEPPPVDRAILLRDDLVARFDAAEDGPALYALIDDATVGKQRAWLKEKRPELFNDVEAAARGAVARTETQSRVDAGDAP